MLCIVGVGKIGLALAEGIVNDPQHEDLTLVEQSVAQREHLATWIQAGGHQRVTVTDSPVASEGTIIAVKPKDVEIAVSDAVNAGAKRILSVAAGVPLARLHEWAGHGIPVLRAIPNIGATVGHSATAVAGAPTTHEEDLVWAEKLLRTVGEVVRLHEDLLDAVTGVASSGPGYIFLIAEALIDAGVNSGLPYDVSKRLVTAMISGAGAMLTQNENLQPVELRAMVTTPAGTTAAGVQVLEQRALRSALIDAVKAAANRSHELGVLYSHNSR